MKKLTTLLMAFGALALIHPFAQAKADDFGAVVKIIERSYNVKHKGIPFLGRMGMKTATLAARVAGGSKRKLAEAGSVKVAYFEDQEFSNKTLSTFRAAMRGLLVPGWSPFIQVLAPQQAEQSYIFLREAGDKFNVLVVNIGQRDASVIQVTLSPQNLAYLMKNPDEMGQSITAEATEDQE